MNDTNGRTTAAVRRSRWPGWIWAVPIAALAIVGWLGWRNFMHSGPEITITFSNAAGMKPQETKVHFRGTVVGTVEKVALSQDHSHIIATAQMETSVADLLREGSRFWLVGTEVSLGNLSDIKSLLTGPYIELDPGPGAPARHFAGLEKPPAVRTEAGGTHFVLLADRRGALESGTPVSYLGQRVGTVEDAKLNTDGSGFHVSVFVRAPFDRFVHGGSRFWRAGAFRLSMADGTIQAQLTSPEALFAGMVAFDTPAAAAGQPIAKPGQQFTLYDNQTAAKAGAASGKRRYSVRFDGAVGDLKVGSAVTLRGFVVGRVADVGLRYDSARDRLETPVTIELNPAKLGLADSTTSTQDAAARLDHALSAMIGRGLRARLTRTPPLIGKLSVALAFDPAAETASLGTEGPHPSIPTSPTGGLGALERSAGAALDDLHRADLPQIAAQLRTTVQHVDALVSSPKLHDSLTKLDSALSNVESVSHSAKEDIGPMLASVQKAAAAARSAMTAASDALAGTPGSIGNGLPDALKEFTSAARAIRVLANYLDRHPEALLQGRDGQ